MMKARSRKERAPTNPESQGRSPLGIFSRKLLGEWRRLKLAQTAEPIIVGVSGGADSAALLLALDELVQAGKLKVQIVVAHLNHKLRGADAEADALWVAALAEKLGHPAVVKRGDIKKRAAKSKDNLEQAARHARYEFFANVARSRKAKLVLTAHTLNDQAETILLNLIRGSGSDGLGGIEPLRPLSAGSEVVLVRPLVTWARRRDTEKYCHLKSIEYRHDEMNFDDSFNRVRVRKEVLPVFETINPKFVENVARNSELFRQDSVALNLMALTILDRDGTTSAPQPLSAARLRVAPAAVRRRALRLWLAQHRGDLRRIEQTHVLAIEKLLFSQKSGRTIELPGGGSAFRQNGLLHYRPRPSR
jgi:tRNA(Ile)-lysidine synthase